ncbi:RNA 2',3'-cyclic phosphodiesterase [Sporosarcina sp. P21c]|nr:RNA 2',3'-cyclic phosphodiesterase [Sporosarcina sp. P16a]PIC89783.1 RNA 2',3'-cyclic phosphodiesterase [Sporosarcina sp. P21c]PIC92512.1 RNA 2',3'-cyclic phosphodiesterase [Sporosarcina sp. P25]
MGGELELVQHYFIGISIAHPVDDIAQQFRTEYQLNEKYKVIPHNKDLHLTMRYIGELDDAKLPWLKSSLQKIAKSHTEFTVYVKGLSFFGSSSGPRVVFLAVQGSEALYELQKQIARRTEKILELEKDTRFVPHITIAKKRKTTDKMQLEKKSIEPVPIIIEGFTLFKINPRETPSYEALAYFPLKKS